MPPSLGCSRCSLSIATGRFPVRGVAAVQECGTVSPSFVLAVACAVAGAGPAHEDPDRAGWTTVADGLAHRHEADLDAEVLRFDLRRFRASVVVPGPGRPLTAAQARAAAGAGDVLAVNGGFFDTAGASLGLRIVGGQVVQGLRPRVDWGVLLLRPGGAAIIHSREYAPQMGTGTLGAIQVGPRLVVAGKVTTLKPQRARRTAVGVGADGTTLIVAVTRERVEATVLADRLLALGAWSALMLDGGPSTQLSFQSGKTEIEIPGGYGVPDLLLIRTR
jgi:hypothetical protein